MAVRQGSRCTLLRGRRKTLKNSCARVLTHFSICTRRSESRGTSQANAHLHQRRHRIAGGNVTPSVAVLRCRDTARNSYNPLTREGTLSDRAAQSICCEPGHPAPAAPSQQAGKDDAVVWGTGTGTTTVEMGSARAERHHAERVDGAGDVCVRGMPAAKGHAVGTPEPDVAAAQPVNRHLCFYRRHPHHSDSFDGVASRIPVRRTVCDVCRAVGHGHRVTAPDSGE